jgi:hypothetical protein
MIADFREKGPGNRDGMALIYMAHLEKEKLARLIQIRPDKFFIGLGQFPAKNTGKTFKNSQ